ncbi:addiction module antidote protein, HigA family [Abditibacterium utsteinense]|uniref:Addiction module antidote protein, HigA family n=1 Tax=Abditibacterium utsteinense TaxID=1960156 RepID=A0A2S8STH9_9BACT|nr:HigA family addiction module antitoxin [Abditibacterium utsteinense]PQV64049.1 addiction module antidote protein, HigA family [Abditibacterium utsteinense]
MNNIPPFLDEGIIEIDGPGFVGDFEDEKGDFTAPRLHDRSACPPHPGAILRELYLPRTGVTLTDLAARIGVSRRSVSMIVNETRPITVDMAHRLGRAFGTSSRFWLNLQRDVDDWKALHEKSSEYERITRLAA